mmetsp:Transcript_3560/g.8372  ORF Transcript_3560/g.8372 Transcript_3560/m.8372 type:complete len:452 (+) Transcript_3560:85-1440(+)
MISDESVAAFISLTSAPVESARAYLEMAGGDLQQAANLFLECGERMPSPSPAAATAAPSGAGVVDADVAAEVAAAAAAAGIDTGPLGPDTEMEAEEVRAPMPAYQDQIINPEVENRRLQQVIAADSAAMERRMSFDRDIDATMAGVGAGAGSEERPDAVMGSDSGAAPGRAINQLFAPPDYNESKTYLQVLAQAKLESKWLLINVQQAEVFASHQLNRDVWSHDTIKDIVTSSFLFWQRDDKSTEGIQFCSYHKCGHQLPHICVIDPRTGRRVKAWDGRKWVELHAAAEYLFAFLDQFSMSRSPVQGSPQASPQASPSLQPQMTPGDVTLTGLDEAPGAQMETEPVEEPAPPAETEPIAALPEEPAESVEHLKVSLKMPSGARVTRRFLPDEPVQQMFLVASALAQQPAGALELSTSFPTRSLRNLPNGLDTRMRDAEVKGSMVLVTLRSS